MRSPPRKIRGNIASHHPQQRGKEEGERFTSHAISYHHGARHAGARMGGGGRKKVMGTRGWIPCVAMENTRMAREVACGTSRLINRTIGIRSGIDATDEVRNSNSYQCRYGEAPFECCLYPSCCPLSGKGTMKTSLPSVSVYHENTCRKT